MEVVFFAILECVTATILAVFVRRISCHVEARTNSGRMKHFPVTFFAAALTCVASSVLFLVAHCATGLAFPSAQACAAYLAAHKPGAFFATVLQFLFGFAVPDCMLLFYLHSITSPITARAPLRPRVQLGPPLTAAASACSLAGLESSAAGDTAAGAGAGAGTASLCGSINSINGSACSLAGGLCAPTASDTTPLLSSAAPVDPVSQLLLSAHQQSLFAASFAGGSGAGSGLVDSPLLDDAPSSTNSSLSSYSFLQADGTPGLASPPPAPLGRADTDSDPSECHGFFDTDSDIDSFYAR